MTHLCCTRLHCPRCRAAVTMPNPLLEAIRSTPCAGFCMVCGTFLRTGGVRLIEVPAAAVPPEYVQGVGRSRMSVIARLS